MEILTGRQVAIRRQEIADRLAQLVVDAEAWNRLHPDEEPIVIDLDLGPDVEEMEKRLGKCATHRKENER